MRRKTILALVIVLSLLMAACANDTSGGGSSGGGFGGKNSPEEKDGKKEDALLSGMTKSKAHTTYTNWMEGLNSDGDDTQFDVDFDMDIRMKAGFENVSMRMDGNMKMVIEDGVEKLAMVMNMDMYGEDIYMEMIFDGAKLYYIMEMQGEEIEMILNTNGLIEYFAMNGEEIPVRGESAADMGFDMNELMDQLNTQMDSTVNLPDFEEEAIKSVETTTVSGGEKITIIVDGSMLSDFVLDSMGDAMDELGGMSSVDMNIGDVIIEAVADNSGNLKSMRMAMKMDMSVMGETVDMEMIMNYTFNQIGSGVVIDIPQIA
ncbi:MAG: hypothetical protein FWG31_04070 [Oscillospiraceae bacterium]|nr:hypothetical protein [Oscillospiraceae bacterium]